MVDVSPRLIHQGVLIKSPPEHKSKDLNRWRKRYFKLWSTKTLEYYKSEKSKEYLKKPIDLNKCKSIDGHLKNKKWENIFCLNTSERKFFLVADSPEIMKEWIGKICDLCGFCEDGSGSQKVDSSPSPTTNTRQPASSASFPSPMADSSPNFSSPRPPTEIPTYDQDLPPLPDSAVAPPSPVVPLREAPSPPVVTTDQADIQLNLSTYDTVPAPIPAEPGTFKRFPSLPSETAKLNQTIKDESYIDMTGEAINTEPIIPPFSPTPLPFSSHAGTRRPNSYDHVPPPIPINRYPNRSNSITGNYDKVPPPIPSDEYIECNLEYQPQDRSGLEDRGSLPARPEPTYTGFDTLPTVERPKSRTQCIGSEDIYDIPPKHSDDTYDVPPKRTDDVNETPPMISSDIYDVPPVKADDIYDVPPGIPVVSDSIYDLPPSRHTYSLENRPNFQDDRNISSYNNVSISELNENNLKNDPSLPQGLDLSQDSIYDCPPPLKTQTSFEIYDVPPNTADLFNFDKHQAPRVDRTLKHVSASHIDMQRANAPPVDRRTRPTIAASVPSFPSSIEQYLDPDSNSCESIYDQPPVQPIAVNDFAGNARVSGDGQSCEQTMTFGNPTDNLQYSEFVFSKNKTQQPRDSQDGSSIEYTAVDQHLTAALHDVRLSREFNHP